MRSAAARIPRAMIFALFVHAALAGGLGPPPPPDVVSKKTEFALRSLALEYARHLQPRSDMKNVHDALRLGAGG